jgi:hypothetical protein
MNDSSNNKITSQIENIDNRSQNGTASHSAQQNIASVTPLLSTPVPSASFSQSNTSDDTAVAQPNVALSHSLQQPPFATSDAETKPVNLSGEELKKVLIQQIEFIMSRDYLASDFNTVSKMNSEYYVPISVVMENSFIKGLTQDRDILLSALKSTDRVIVDEARMMVKPNIKIQRNTIILRDIAPDVPREDIKALFDEYQDKIEDLHSDVGNTWFVSFVNEDITQSAFAVCRSKQFHGKPVQARVKSENLLKSVYVRSVTVFKFVLVFVLSSLSVSVTTLPQRNHNRLYSRSLQLKPPHRHWRKDNNFFLKRCNRGIMPTKVSMRSFPISSLFFNSQDSRVI